MPPDGQQAPAVVAGHAVGLLAGHGGGVAAQHFQLAQRIQRRIVAVVFGPGAGRKKLRFGAHDEVPVLLRQAVAHGRCGAQNAAQVEAHAGHLSGLRQPGDQRALEHAPCLPGRRHRGQHQPLAHAHGAQPGQQRLRGLVLTVQALQRDARQARDVLGALGVAAQPEQVFGRAAGHLAAALHHSGRGLVVGQQRGGVHRAIGLHPHIGTAAAALHRRDAAVALGQAGQPARQHAPRARAVAHRKHAQHHRAGGDGAAALARTLCGFTAPGGHLRQRQVGLHGVFIALRFDARGPLRQVLRRQRAAQHGHALRHGPGGADHAVRELRQHRLHGRAFATPPGGQRRQGQLFAQQVARQRGHEAQQRRRFEERRARRIGHQHVARADGLQQARHAQTRVAAQLQRVQKLVVQALQDAVHRLQAVQRLEVQARVAYREVVALHQRQAQVARQVGVFKVGLVVRARREQHDARIGTRRAHLPQPVEQRAVGGGQALHMHLAERLGEQARDEQPVLQQIPQARGSLCALCDHPPVALRIARHVERRNVQMHAAHRLNAVHGAQVAGVALHQGAGQQAAAQQLLRAIDVGHHAVEQAGALQHAALDVRPVALREDQRKQVHRPGPLRAVGVGIDVVGDAVVAHLPLQALHAPVQVLKALGAQLIEKLGPGASDVWVVCYGFRS